MAAIALSDSHLARDRVFSKFHRGSREREIAFKVKVYSLKPPNLGGQH